MLENIGLFFIPKKIFLVLFFISLYFLLIFSITVFWSFIREVFFLWIRFTFFILLFRKFDTFFIRRLLEFLRFWINIEDFSVLERGFFVVFSAFLGLFLAFSSPM